MQFSNFTRKQEGSKIIFFNSSPLKGINTLKYYKDDASGAFTKKEFRWSFNESYWSSWETLNQGNLSRIKIGTNPYLFLEIRYISAGGSVTKFTLNYEGAIQKEDSSSKCPAGNNYITQNELHIS